MDPSIIKEIGGGLSAVVIVALAAFVVMLLRRNDTLVDKLLANSENGAQQAREMHEKTLTAVNALTTATQSSNATAQAAVAMLEREKRQ